MEITFEKIGGGAINIGRFVRHYEYSATTDDREYVRQIAKHAKDSKTKIHCLSAVEHGIKIELGFVAISIFNLESKPSLYINYLFVSAPYRKIIQDSLGGQTIGTFLIAHAIEVAKNFPIKNIVLEPANLKLEKYYKNFGFNHLKDTNFLFLKI